MSMKTRCSGRLIWGSGWSPSVPRRTRTSFPASMRSGGQLPEGVMFGSEIVLRLLIYFKCLLSTAMEACFSRSSKFHDAIQHFLQRNTTVFMFAFSAQPPCSAQRRTGEEYQVMIYRTERVEMVERSGVLINRSLSMPTLPFPALNMNTALKKRDLSNRKG